MSVCDETTGEGCKGGILVYEDQWSEYRVCEHNRLWIVAKLDGYALEYGPNQGSHFAVKLRDMGAELDRLKSEQAKLLVISQAFMHAIQGVLCTDTE